MIDHDHVWSSLLQDLLHQTYQCLVTQCAMPSFAVLTMRMTYCSGREMITTRQTQQQRKLPAIHKLQLFIQVLLQVQTKATMIISHIWLCFPDPWPQTAPSKGEKRWSWTKPWTLRIISISFYPMKVKKPRNRRHFLFVFNDFTYWRSRNWSFIINMSNLHPN